jgi:epoxyqueuosine reductase
VKLLAVRTGLAEYGRNNIAYVHSMGSFVRLDAFATDADLVPADEPRAGLSPYLVGGREPVYGHWSPPRRMGSCAACKACHHACPTGCIPFPEEGVVIEAERCLTYLNEHEGEWPEWLDPAAHNCLVGCMRCQLVCPANKYYLGQEEVVAEFDREETEMVLEDLPEEELPDALRAKLSQIDLDGYSTVLGRNLRALEG